MSSFTQMHNDYLDPDRYFTQEVESNEVIVSLIEEYGSPYSLYRAIYKSSVGHSIGIEIDGEMVYCDNLPSEFDLDEHTVTAISVSSIVEGSDVSIDGAVLSGKFTKEDFWNLVEKVAKEVSFYWERDNSVYFSIDGDCFQWISFDDKPKGAEDFPFDLEDSDLMSEFLDTLDTLDADNPIEFRGKTLTKLETPDIFYC